MSKPNFRRFRHAAPHSPIALCWHGNANAAPAAHHREKGPPDERAAYRIGHRSSAASPMRSRSRSQCARRPCSPRRKHARPMPRPQCVWQQRQLLSKSWRFARQTVCGPTCMRQSSLGLQQEASRDSFCRTHSYCSTTIANAQRPFSKAFSGEWRLEQRLRQSPNGTLHRPRNSLLRWPAPARVVRDSLAAACVFTFKQIKLKFLQPVAEISVYLPINLKTRLQLN